MPSSNLNEPEPGAIPETVTFGGPDEGIAWQRFQYEKDCKAGRCRVLIMDHMPQRDVAAGGQIACFFECDNLDDLQMFYRLTGRGTRPVLRTITVQQGAPWAHEFFKEKYNLADDHDIQRTLFDKLQASRAPSIDSQHVEMQRDSRRGIKRSALACVYLRPVLHSDLHQVTRPGSVTAFMRDRTRILCPQFPASFKSYGSSNEPVSKAHLYYERVSVYIQTVDDDAPQIITLAQGPWSKQEHDNYQKLKESYNIGEVYSGHVQHHEVLDNSSTIIIFDGSTDISSYTLCGAQEAWEAREARRQRLGSCLVQTMEMSTETLVAKYTDSVLTDIFQTVINNWRAFLRLCETHVDILEQSVYEWPADDGMSPDLVKMSLICNTVCRMLYSHGEAAKSTQRFLSSLTDQPGDDGNYQLDAIPALYEKIAENFDKCVIQRVTIMFDLMFKVVGLRDTRTSLQTGDSMWRLSWITFIFLPLTFAAGVFGMNVETFASNPPIKWWFITSIAILALVFSLWIIAKLVRVSDQTMFHKRRIYRDVNESFAKNFPDYWSLRGPRSNIKPRFPGAAFIWRVNASFWDAEKIKPRSHLSDAEGIRTMTKTAITYLWLFGHVFTDPWKKSEVEARKESEAA